MIRTGHVARTTAETDIDLTLCLFDWWYIKWRW